MHKGTASKYSIPCPPQKKARKMEAVDDLIDSLANHIKARIKSGERCGSEIAEKTEALAKLISAKR